MLRRNNEIEANYEYISESGVKVDEFSALRNSELEKVSTVLDYLMSIFQRQGVEYVVITEEIPEKSEIHLKKKGFQVTHPEESRSNLSAVYDFDQTEISPGRAHTQAEA